MEEYSGNIPCFNFPALNSEQIRCCSVRLLWILLSSVHTYLTFDLTLWSWIACCFGWVWVLT